MFAVGSRVRIMHGGQSRPSTLTRVGDPWCSVRLDDGRLGTVGACAVLAPHGALHTHTCPHCGLVWNCDNGEACPHTESAVCELTTITFFTGSGN